MIRPEEYEAAVTKIRFLCGAAFDGRQYTFVELIIEERTDREFEISFYVPNQSNARDELNLLTILGGDPVNEAMDAWDKKMDFYDIQKYTKAIEGIRAVENEMSVAVSGCSEVAVVKMPRGPCIVSSCWSHDITKNKIFIPTQNENISSWRVDMIAMQGFVDSHGKRATTSLSRCFRFDLASTQARISFCPVDNATLIQRTGPSLPFHNLWVPLKKQSLESREFHSICGAVLQDNTSKRLMTFYEVMFVAVPVICGCFIRNTVSFPNSYVPLTLSERVSRLKPVTFDDAPDGSSFVVVKFHGVPVYCINLEKRETYSGVNWVSLLEISR